jgi:uncharacterized protein (DUF2235 family)
MLFQMLVSPRRICRRFPILSGCCLLVLAARPLVAQPNSETNTVPAMETRRIVLCLDGTWNSTYNEAKRSDGSTVLKPSNVLKLCRAVKPRADNGREQLTYYDIGVGSLAEYPGTANHLLHSADKLLGGGWGAGFEGNIEDALEFLVLNYRPGDTVYIFGFSRGAATARGLTHFLDWTHGLIPTKRDAYYLPGIFRAYILSKGTSTVEAALVDINKDRARDQVPPLELGQFQKVDIQLLGVWDTVMALGSRFRAKGTSTSGVSKSFHVDRQPARCVRHAMQALAIDEVRYDFRPEIWTDHWPDQTLEQRWFAGVHSNIGGGYVDDGLANVAFHWILDGAEAQGLEVDRQFARFYRPFPQDRLYRSESLLYRILDGLRLRFGRGKRQLVGQPATANLTLSPSVIHRLRADPHESKKGGQPGELRFPELKGKPYRPENVLLFLACQPDLDQYLKGLGLDDEHRQLPADVLRRMTELRPRCGQQSAAGR